MDSVHVLWQVHGYMNVPQNVNEMAEASAGGYVKQDVANAWKLKRLPRIAHATIVAKGSSRAGQDPKSSPAGRNSGFENLVLAFFQ